MFIINEDKSIYITRGDVAFFSIEAKTDTGETYKFLPGDVVRFKVFEKKACENVVLQKDFGIESEAEEVSIYLEEKDTKIGDVISKPVDYWYEVELNPYTDPQTIIGYDDDGAKVFKLYPEGNETEDNEPITPEDIPVIDEELDLTSTRPVQNQAIARAILKINEDVKTRIDSFEEEVDKGLGDVVTFAYAEEHYAVKRVSPMLTQESAGVFSVPVSNCVIVCAYTQAEGYICNPYFDGYNWKMKITNAATNEPADTSNGFMPIVHIFYINCEF